MFRANPINIALMNILSLNEGYVVRATRKPFTLERESRLDIRVRV